MDYTAVEKWKYAKDTFFEFYQLELFPERRLILFTSIRFVIFVLVLMPAESHIIGIEYWKKYFTFSLLKVRFSIIGFQTFLR